MKVFTALLVVSFSFVSCSEDSESGSYEYAYEDKDEGTASKKIDIGTDTWFTIVREYVTWDEAFEKCKLKGKNGRLASIDSSYITNKLEKYVYILGHSLWIGIRKEPSGTLNRTGNAQSSYLNWDEGEPNELGVEDCVELLPWSMKWNDLHCDRKRSYLCAHDKDTLEDTGIVWINSTEDTLYSIDRNRATWDEAFRICKTRGLNGRLATIDSKSTLDSLRSHMKDIRGNIWIGIYRIPSNSFKRIGGIESGFFNWAEGEPNNHGQENCVVMRSWTLEFNDVKCDYRTRYLCTSNRENGTSSVSSKSVPSLVTVEPSPNFQIFSDPSFLTALQALDRPMSPSLPTISETQFLAALHDLDSFKSPSVSTPPGLSNERLVKVKAITYGIVAAFLLFLVVLVQKRCSREATSSDTEELL